MIEALQTLTAITDPVANVAIIGIALWQFKQHTTQVRHDERISNIERELFR